VRHLLAMALTSGRCALVTVDHDTSQLTAVLGQTMNDEPATEKHHQTSNKLAGTTWLLMTSVVYLYRLKRYYDVKGLTR